MDNLFNIILKNRNWSGSRDDFVKLISSIENSKPKQRVLYSVKYPYDALPITSRRVQWFSSKNIMPKPNGKLYEYEHLVYYWLAILLRKQKLTFKQLEGLASDVSLKQAEERLDPKSGKLNLLETPGHPSNASTSEAVTEGLRRMGREEGRALKSTLIRLAITPWCHVTLNENNISSLTAEDAEILTDAFRQSLSRVMSEN
jgi:hypothetical protein